MPDLRDRRWRERRCSFCGKRHDQVRKLVAGPGVYICDQCVELCNEVIQEGPPPQASQHPGAGSQSGWIRRITSRLALPWVRRSVAATS